MTETARAALITAPGRVEIREYPIPEITADTGLLKVEASGLGGADYETFNAPPERVGGLRVPFIPGHIVVGRIHRVGPDAARRWGVGEGDRVLVQYDVPCGVCARCRFGNPRRCERLLGYGLWFDFEQPPYLWGGVADYMFLHANSAMVRLPDDMDPVKACILERLSDALNWLVRRGGLTPYDSLLVMGTGALAHSAIATGRLVGATPVMVLARPESTRKEQARRAGADAVLSGSAAEVAAAVAELTGGRMADVVIDTTTGDARDVTAVAVQSAGYRGRIVQVAVKRGGDMAGIDGPSLLNKELSLISVWGHEFEDLERAVALAGNPAVRDLMDLEIGRYRLDDIAAALGQLPAADGSVLGVVVLDDD